MQEAVRECCLHRRVHESEKAEDEQRATVLAAKHVDQCYQLSPIPRPDPATVGLCDAS